MPSSGSVASRVARPRTRSAEQPSSNVAAIVAARSGDSTGTLYSSANSCTVVSQDAILVSPALMNTLATASRNISCSTGSGNRPSTSRRCLSEVRTPEAGIVVSAWVVMSGLLGVLAAAHDLVARARGDVDPRVALVVALGGAGARRVGGLAVVLAGLGDAEALLGLELRLRCGTGVRQRGVRHRERDRKSTRLNSSHLVISYAVFCLKKKINFRPCDRNDMIPPLHRHDLLRSEAAAPGQAQHLLAAPVSP